MPIQDQQYVKAFRSAYQKLNPPQKIAVDAIDGPVLVVAGPGTGKTQILALRIGQILLQTDTNPAEILCLTFTDAGQIAMRQRLLQYIGPSAYNVNIHTYHSFCNQVIQENQDYFSRYKKLFHASELEEVELLKELIDQFPVDHPLKRFKGQPYYEAKRLRKLFALIKKEGWTVPWLMAHVKNALSNLDKDPDLFYKKNGSTYRIGDKKPQYEKKKSQLIELQAAIEAFELFQGMMREAGLYNFDDMILWVLEAFKQQPDLLLQYQEQYQYFLVDEYQDTNGSQNEILQLLCNYWDRPNLFVVGDDDQAIFRFQGANIHNLIQLYRHYDPQVVVLTHNYRSGQKILNAAMGLIQHNLSRITNEVPGIDKVLTASGENQKFEMAPRLIEFASVAQEESYIIDQIKRLKNKGTRLSEIAVIYRKHSQASNLIKVLERENIPVDVKQRVDILKEPLVQNIIQILRYLHEESVSPNQSEKRLFEILHYRFFSLKARDISKLAEHCWHNSSDRLSLRDVLGNPALMEESGYTDVPSLSHFNELIDSWLSSLPHLTFQRFFEKMLKEANIFKEIFGHSERTFQMQVLATLFNFIKDESLKNPGLTLAEFLHMLDRLAENEIGIQMVKLIRSKSGVQFLTAHAAKGLEFDHVYVIGCTRFNWQRSQSSYNEYALPGTIIPETKNDNVEDQRRLIYVALTRARKNAQLTFSSKSIYERDQEMTQFLEELREPDQLPVGNEVIGEDALMSYHIQLMGYSEQKLPLIDHELVEKALRRFAMSPTSLNKYLQCPRTFYFEVILRIPLAKSPYLGFGKAVHSSLEELVVQFKKTGHLSQAVLLQAFEEAMQRAASHFTRDEYDRHMIYGAQILPQFFDYITPRWKKTNNLYTEFPIRGIEYRGVPLRGNIDLIEQYDQNYHIIDYKTGNTNNRANISSKTSRPKTMKDAGGNYWRQMVFYKLLLDRHSNHNIRMSEGRIFFVEPNKEKKFYAPNFIISISDEDFVGQQITSSYESIKNHEFDKNCDDPKCYWCNFVNNDFTFSDELEATLIEADYQKEEEDHFEDHDQIMGQLALF